MADTKILFSGSEEEFEEDFNNSFDNLTPVSGVKMDEESSLAVIVSEMEDKIAKAGFVLLNKLIAGIRLRFITRDGDEYILASAANGLLFIQGGVDFKSITPCFLKACIGVDGQVHYDRIVRNGILRLDCESGHWTTSPVQEMYVELIEAAAA